MPDPIVKLTKTSNRKVGDKEYIKYMITIPQRFTNELEWSDKTELNMRLQGNKIVIEEEKKI